MFCFGGNSIQRLATAAAKMQPATARRTFSAKKISVERFQYLFSYHDSLKSEVCEILDRSRICAAYEGKKHYGCTFTRLDSDYKTGNFFRFFHLFAFEKATAEKSARLLGDSQFGFHTEEKAEYALKYMIEETERKEEAEDDDGDGDGDGDGDDDDNSS